MVLVDSIYINESGGKVLLEYLITFLKQNNQIGKFFFLFDPRLSSEATNAVDPRQFAFLNPSEKERKRFYDEHIDRFSSVFCFANVPPPVRIRNKKVTILFHNTLILDNAIAGFSFPQKVRYFIKKGYIRFRNKPYYNWVVQTRSVKELVGGELGVKASNIHVLPFYKPFKSSAVSRGAKLDVEWKELHFLYVASSSKQKNHVRLLKACSTALSGTDFHLTLHLTLPAPIDPDVAELIQVAQGPQVTIINHGACTYDRVQQLYQQCDIFVFPSLTESFGLPLIEAASLGCKVVASDLPFVHDVVKPSLTFNALDINCMAKAIALCFKKQLPDSELLVENQIKDLVIKIQ